MAGSMFDTVGAVIHLVEDVGPVRDWYVSVLGVEPTMEQPNFVAWNLGGAWMGFDADSIYEGVRPTRDSGTVVYWNVSDIFSAFARMTAAGATPRGGINEVEGMKLALLFDPWGNGVGLMEAQAD